MFGCTHPRLPPVIYIVSEKRKMCQDCRTQKYDMAVSVYAVTAALSMQWKQNCARANIRMFVAQPAGKRHVLISAQV